MKGEIRVKNKSDINTKRKGKRKMGWIIVLIIIAVLGVVGAKGWSHISKEHNEAKNLPLNAVNFSKLNDGTYIGEYEGGMYKWRTNKVQVTVSSGKVTDIKIQESKAKLTLEFTGKLYDRVIKAQSLQVDAISGATLDSKACLKSIENALIKAQKSK
jgi:uncharacterized protein with FMN-binding domain